MSLFKARYADGQRLDIDGFAVRLKVSARARRVSLRVDRLRGEAVAVAPSTRRLADAVAFARERRGWIADRLADTPPPERSLAPGAVLQVLGAPWLLQPDGRRPRLIAPAGPVPGRLVGCGEGAVESQLVVRAIRREALEVFTARATAHCASLGAPLPAISLTDTRSRWGSCTPARANRPAAIRLSWRLALAPFAVADYVVAHECAHLLQANHGPEFWSLVHALVGHETAHRAWLRVNGAGLHAILPKAS